MIVLGMLRRSGAVALLVHMTRVAFAAFAAAPLALPIQRELSSRVFHRKLDAGDAALLLQVTIEHVSALLSVAGGVALLYLVLTPLLAMLWLHAMLDAPDLPTIRQRALADYPSALLLGGAAILALGVVEVGVAGALHALPEHIPDAVGAHAALRIAGLAVGGAGFIAVATVHDRARAALCLRAKGARDALRVSTQGICSRDFVYRALVALSYGGLAAVAEFASRAASGHAAPFVIAGLEQLCVVPATVVQALWLARTLATARHYGGAGARQRLA